MGTYLGLVHLYFMLCPLEGNATYRCATHVNIHRACNYLINMTYLFRACQRTNKNRLSLTILTFSAEPDILKYPLSRFTLSDLDVFSFLRRFNYTLVYNRKSIKRERIGIFL